ncbi:MAG: histone deacetylase [Dehalococcoidales bacterium]|nr:histone deacetylase [Dehalococcoidales bacterium]
MIGILYEETIKEYDFGLGHSFRGDRYDIFPPFLKQHLAEGEVYQILKAIPANDDDLSLICQKDYIDFNKGFYEAANLGLSYPGNFLQFQSGDNKPNEKSGKIEIAARLIIGQAKLACDLIQENKLQKVISIGGGMHHAKPNSGEGFCIYNDVAFCAKYLQQKYNLDRILILDTDAHAGNGTAEYFYEDPKVLFVDLHQDPRTVYPGTGYSFDTGAGDGKGYTINIPLPVYAGKESYRLAFEEIIMPVVKEYKPQIIIRNGGSDPHVSDGLTALGLNVSGFKMIADTVREMSQICDGKVIDLIGSGYNKNVLPYSWLALVSGVAGVDTALEEPEAIPPWLNVDRFLMEINIVINDVKKNLRDQWHCLR